VNLVDANVLLYAVNSDSDRHAASRQWLDEALSGGAVVGFAWVAVLAFLRLSTKPGIFPSPLSDAAAVATVDAWLAQPAAVVVEPTARHLALLRELVTSAGSAGNLVNDAHLAALAIEHRGRVVSYDSDFGRFPGVTWGHPGPLSPPDSR
jgi:toxin-antitoxin system PIN domain toxin